MDTVCYLMAGVALIGGICGLALSPEGGWLYLVCGVICAIVFVYQGMMMASVKAIRKTIAENIEDPFLTFAKKYYREILAKSLQEHLKADSLPVFTDAMCDRYPTYVEANQGGYYEARASFVAPDSAGNEKFYAISVKLICVDTARFWSKDAWKCDGSLKKIK